MDRRRAAGKGRRRKEEGEGRTGRRKDLTSIGFVCASYCCCFLPTARTLLSPTHLLLYSLRPLCFFLPSGVFCHCYSVHAFPPFCVHFLDVFFLPFWHGLPTWRDVRAFPRSTRFALARVCAFSAALTRVRAPRARHCISGCSIYYRMVLMCMYICGSLLWDVLDAWRLFRDIHLLMHAHTASTICCIHSIVCKLLLYMLGIVAVCAARILVATTAMPLHLDLPYLIDAHFCLSIRSYSNCAYAERYRRDVRLVWFGRAWQARLTTTFSPKLTAVIGRELTAQNNTMPA